MPDPAVELQEITPANVARIVKMLVKPEQAGFVAPNAYSLSEAYVYQDRAWPRAICADGEPVGFVMLEILNADHPEAPDGKPSYYLWRFMIGAEYQGKGYGRAAIKAVIDYVKTLPDAACLKTSYVPGDGCAGPFYEKLGFTPTGEVEGREVILSFKLT